MLNRELSSVDKTTAFRAGIIGIFLIIVGVINDVIGITFLWKSDSHFDGVFLRRAHGIWTGVLLLIAGFFGIAVWVKVEEMLVKVFAVLNTIVVILVSVQLIMVIIIVDNFDNYTEANSKCKVTMNDCECDGSVLYQKERCSHYPWALNMFVGLVVCTLLGLISSLVASVIGWVAVRQGAGKSSVALRRRSPRPTSVLNANKDHSPSPSTLQRQKSPSMFLSVETAELSTNNHHNRKPTDTDA